MTTLINNQEVNKMAPGIYEYHANGALDLQRQLFSEGFSTLKSFTEDTRGIVELAPGDLKVINAGANAFTLKLIRML